MTRDLQRSRRTVLKTGAAAIAGAPALAGCGGGGGGSGKFGGFMDGVGNYDGTVTDRTGQDEVTITVGVDGNGGHLAFGPPAVRVSTGTTVVWTWSGKGGSHNVVDEGGSFESKLTAEAGFTFDQTVDSAQTVKYYCQPHRMRGMKGVVVVE
ncbi:MAG: halocyanin domain-containing protein [Halobacteriaceae archaeon]